MTSPGETTPAHTARVRRETLRLVRAKLSAPALTLLLLAAMWLARAPAIDAFFGGDAPELPPVAIGADPAALAELEQWAASFATDSTARTRTGETVRTVLSIGFIAAFAWLVLRLIDVVQAVLVERFRVDVRDNLKARRVHTQTRVLARTADLIVIVIACAAILYLFEPVRQLGTALLASAGVAGLVIGLAARPVFENLVAGVQIALTQPINIDDAVIVDGEWGWIEHIGAAYVVVKVWDQRRLVVPLSYFINTPFQNWTKQTSELLGTVFLHVDYLMSVDALRVELDRLLKNTELWDGRVQLIQVTEAREQTVQLRVLVSAESSPKLWDLRCYVREGLVRFLQREHPESLPRVRASVRDVDPAELDEAARFERRFRERNFAQESGLTQEGLLPEEAEAIEQPRDAR